MKVSFHGGHSAQFCDHAKNSLEEIVLEYIKQGFTHIGLSEHQPRSKNFLYKDEIKLGRTEDYLNKRFSKYVNEAKRLQEKYSDKIKILVGFETEACEDNAYALIHELKEKFNLDYIVGSVHHVKQIPFDTDKDAYNKALENFSSHEEMFLEYYDTQHRLIQACEPEIIGHFDLIRIFAPDIAPTEKIKSAILRNIKAAINCGSIFEINTRALKKGLDHPFPTKWILEEIIKNGGSITFGDDSHGVEDVGNYYEEMLDYISDLSGKITYLELN